MTARDLITEAFQDLGILAASETLSNTDAQFGLSKLTRLFDNWNAERRNVWATRLASYVLTPNLSPHTIGPTGTFNAAVRPVSLDGANLVLTNSGPAIHFPLNLRDAEWYRNRTIPTLATSIPTDLYYEPDWPNGSLYLWTIPTVAYSLELQTRVLLSALQLGDTVNYPPGYRDAITRTLGEMIAPTYPAALVDRDAAREARARIQANNAMTPRLATRDEGMPKTATTNRSTFNYKTGLNR